MDKLFEPWKKRILDKENEISVDYTPMTDIVTIGDAQVYVYNSLRYPIGGMWLQSSDGHIRIYSCNDKKEGITHRYFSKDNERGPIHQHDCIEIGYVVEGCARQAFSGKEYRFNSGDFWIVDQNCYHSDIYSRTDLFTVYISISSEVFDSTFLRTIDNTEIHRFISFALLQQKKNRQFLHFIPRDKNTYGAVLMEQLLREIIERKIGFESIVKGLLERLLNGLSMEYDFQLSSQEKRKRNDILFHEIEKYIQENYRTASIQNLVDKFHYNEDFYNRLIKEYSGYTYSGYLKNVRLVKAAKLLESSSESIEEISFMLGYQSRGHFYQLFSEKYGMTPAKYRKEHSKK